MSTTTRTTSRASGRHVPQRTCVGCRRTGDQSSFVRLVRVSADGATRVKVDESPRRTAGRGAYLCRDQQCWDRSLKGALAASLRASLDATNRDALQSYAVRFAQSAQTEQNESIEPTASAGATTEVPAGQEEGEDS